MTRYRWCNDGITKERWSDYDGAIEHRIIAIVSSHHHSINPNTMVQWCDSELHCTLPYPDSILIWHHSIVIAYIYHRIIALLRLHTIAIALPHHSHCIMASLLHRPRLRWCDGELLGPIRIPELQLYKIDFFFSKGRKGVEEKSWTGENKEKHMQIQLKNTYTHKILK